MRLLLTGHKGYIGAVAAPILRSAGHEVTGLDTDLFAGCEFGEGTPEIPEVRKDLRARYPKHSWPDDPLTARAEAKGRRKP